MTKIKVGSVYGNIVAVRRESSNVRGPKWVGRCLTCKREQHYHCYQLNTKTVCECQSDTLAGDSFRAFKLKRVWTRIRQNYHLCDAWRMSYAAFAKSEAGQTFQPDLFLRAKDPKKPIGPMNFVWAKVPVRRADGRNTFLLYQYHDELLSIHEIAELIGITYRVAYDRLKIKGLTVEQAIQRGKTTKRRKGQEND